MAVSHRPVRDRLPRDPVDLREELERAVERNELGLEYQPMIDLQSGSIAGVEALLRWRHSLLGTIPVGDYLPIAEETSSSCPSASGCSTRRAASSARGTWPSRDCRRCP
jgi:EAL domain-containing protein (putative c-di-GMP-specific phosphodiesterase class I)